MIGVGGVGHIALQLLRVLGGGTVIGDRHRRAPARALAKELGADEVLRPDVADVREATTAPAPTSSSTSSPPTRPTRPGSTCSPGAASTRPSATAGRSPSPRWRWSSARRRSPGTSSAAGSTSGSSCSCTGAASHAAHRDAPAGRRERRARPAARGRGHRRAVRGVSPLVSTCRPGATSSGRRRRTLRERSESAALGMAAPRAQARARGLRRPLALVGDRPGGLLGVALGLLRDPAQRRTSGVLGSREHAGRRVVPRRAAELRRAHARPRRGRDAVAVVARSQSRDPFELTFGELREQVARARAGPAAARRRRRATGSSPTCRTSRRRSSPSSRARASARSGRRARPSSASAASSTGSGQLEPKVLLAVDGYSYGDKLVDRREQVGRRPGAAADARAVVHVPYAAAPTTLPDAVALGRAPRRARSRSSSSRCRSPTRSTCSSRRARPACRRRSSTATAASCRAPEEPRPELGPAARRPAPVVHDDRVDDVERARLDAAAARVDRDDRRQPRLPRPLVPVAARRGDAADDDRA